MSDIVHTPYPFHLAIRLKLLGDVFLLYHMFYKLRKHFFCLLVDFSKVGVQLAAKKQGCIYGIAVFTEIPTPFLAPNANRSGLWRHKIGNEIIALLMIGSTHALK